jgi:hypothetical protein
MPNTPPILKITDGKGNFLPEAPFIVLATMFYPDDLKRRELYLEANLGRLLIEIETAIPRDLAIEAAAAAAGLDSSINHASNSAYGMTVSGDLLLHIINAALYSPTDASLERAIRVWCEDQARGKTHEGRGVAASPRSVKSAWSRFKPVAHLCAAWRLSHIQSAAEWDPTDPETLLRFLAVAEGLREFGEWHRPPSGRTGSKPSRTPTLDPETTWKLPPDLTIPPVVLSVPPLTEFARKVLENYRAD